MEIEYNWHKLPRDVCPCPGMNIGDVLKETNKPHTPTDIHTPVITRNTCYNRICTTAASMITKDMVAIIQRDRRSYAYETGVLFDMTAVHHVHTCYELEESTRNVILKLDTHIAMRGFNASTHLIDTECEDCCYDWQVALDAVLFSTGMKIREGSILFIMMKILPYRCQTRQVKAKTQLVDSDDVDVIRASTIFKCLRRCFYMWLSGNMRGRRDDTRPTRLVRYRLMALYLSDDSFMIRRSCEIIAACPHLTLFIVRAVTRNGYEQDVAMIDTLKMAFKYDEFNICIDKAMFEVDRHINVLSCVIGYSIFSESSAEHCPFQLPVALVSSIWTLHRIQQRLNNAIPDVLFINVIYSVIGNRYNKSICNAKRSRNVEARSANMMKSIDLAMNTISDDVAEVMELIILRHGSETTEGEFNILRDLHLLDLHPHLCRFLCVLQQCYYNGAVSSGVLILFINDIAKRFPRMGVLLGVLSCVWKRACVVNVYPLHEHYMMRQLKALAMSFNQTQTNIEGQLVSYIPFELTQFLYCDVCNTIYSLVSKTADICKQVYRHGYKKVNMDYYSMSMYCSREHIKFFPRMSCRENKLRSLTILGHIAKVGKHLVTLCPGDGCGRPLAIDVERTSYIENGFICSQCVAIREKNKPQPQWFENIKHTCVVCDKPITHIERAMYLARGFVYCRTHRIGPLLNTISGLVQSNQSTQQIELAISEYRRQTTKQRIKSIGRSRLNRNGKPVTRVISSGRL
jgi:hypothetical protein